MDQKHQGHAACDDMTSEHHQAGSLDGPENTANTRNFQCGNGKQPASLNGTGYNTLPPDEQRAIRRLLKMGGNDTPSNRDHLADLLDDAGSDSFVLEMVRRKNPVILTVKLDGGKHLAFSVMALALAFTDGGEEC